MTDLATWLLEQIDVDERTARDASPGPWEWKEWWGSGDVELRSLGTDQVVLHAWGDYGYGATIDCTPADRQHIATWDPVHVIAECDAKRRIVKWATFPRQGSEDEWESEGDRAAATYMGDSVLRALAAPYVDRPGYRPEWRP